MNERKSRGGVGGHSALAAGSRGNATKCKSIFPQLHQLIFLFFVWVQKKEKSKKKRRMKGHYQTMCLKNWHNSWIWSVLFRLSCRRKKRVFGSYLVQTCKEQSILLRYSVSMLDLNAAAICEWMWASSRIIKHTHKYHPVHGVPWRWNWWWWRNFTLFMMMMMMMMMMMPAQCGCGVCWVARPEEIAMPFDAFNHRAVRFFKRHWNFLLGQSRTILCQCDPIC